MKMKDPVSISFFQVYDKVILIASQMSSPVVTNNNVESAGGFECSTAVRCACSQERLHGIPQSWPRRTDKTHTPTDSIRCLCNFAK